MTLKLHLSQEQLQKLTPQQIQLSALLQLPIQNLEQAIDEELEKNPALEIDEEATLRKLERKKGDENRDRQESYDDPEYDWESLFSRANRSAGFSYGGREESPDLPQPDTPGFFEKILQQIRTSGLSEEDMTIAEQIIWNTDSDGYLKVPVENIAYRLNVAPEKVEGVLHLIQQMDPPGIGSRDLRECLLSQLREMDVPDYVVKIVKYHFNDFANHRFEQILRQLNISREDLDKARKIIGRLNPKPASDDSSFDNYVVVPDLIVTEENGVFQVMVNDGSIPELKISSTYLDLVSRKKKVDKETRDYLKKKIDSARWFIQSVYQRRDTMVRVMKAIIKRQKPFFEGRLDSLKPMILKDIAEDVGMDISTISRVTNGKYVQTPVGLYELKYFFSEGMKDVDGDDVSTRLIKQALKEIVDHEDKRHPLNDEKMVRALEERGFNIARRTVAKYREQMGIPVARLRREL